MKELIKIENRPAIVDVNFDELREHLAKDLEKYEVVVTADTVKGAKELAKELNATKAVISKRRKDEVAKASEPVKRFDQNMKELEAMCESGRQRILEQVRRFEDETKEKVRELLQEQVADLRAKHEVNDEFQTSSVEDQVLLTSITAKGRLTAKAVNALRQKVSEEKRLQDRTEMRLLKLENESYKAGLSAPLTRHHVESFLFEDAETYQRELDRIMDAELERQKVAERRMRDQLDHEQQEREHRESKMAEQAQPEPQPDPEPSAPETESKPRRAAPNGKIAVSVTCVFETSVAPGVTDEQIDEELRAVLQRAGIKSLSSVSILRHQKAA